MGSFNFKGTHDLVCTAHVTPNLHTFQSVSPDKSWHREFVAHRPQDASDILQDGEHALLGAAHAKHGQQPLHALARLSG